METTGETTGLFDKIRPPHLEDAGLEDCALPPDSIKEAFLKAASAVRSSIFSNSEDESDGDCVNDPLPGHDVGESVDVLVGITTVPDPPGACAPAKGGGVAEAAGDDVNVVGVRDAEETADKVVEPAVAESCVDGLQGLKIGACKDQKQKRDEEDGEEGERPTLAEVLV